MEQVSLVEWRHQGTKYVFAQVGVACWPIDMRDTEASWSVQTPLLLLLIHGSNPTVDFLFFLALMTNKQQH